MESINNYQEGLALAEAGRCNEALYFLQEHLRSNSDDAEVLNDIGAVLHCLGRGDEAVGYLLRAKNLQPQNPNPDKSGLGILLRCILPSTSLTRRRGTSKIWRAWEC